MRRATDTEQQAVWDAQVELYRTMTPPLRIHASEVAQVASLVRQAGNASRRRRLEVLVLGLIPEILDIDWPGDCRVCVVDRSEVMIKAFWPGGRSGRLGLVKGDWARLPFEKDRFDLVIGDGGFNLAAYPKALDHLGGELARVMRPGARLSARVFVQVEPREDTALILDEFREAETIDYYALRLRLAQSLQDRAEEGIFVTKSSLDELLVARGISLESLYRRSGYRPPDVPAITHDDAPAFRLTYPTAGEFTAVMGRHLTYETTWHGSHPLASRTPMFAFRRVD